MRIEGLLNSHPTRRAMLAGTAALLAEMLLRPTAHANVRAADAQPPGESPTQIINAPRAIRAKPDRPFYRDSIGTLSLPPESGLSLRFSLGAQFSEAPGVQLAGLLIDAESVGHPNFSRTMFACRKDGAEESWRAAQLVGENFEEILIIAAGSGNTDFMLDLSRAGTEGTIETNAGVPVELRPHHSIFGLLEKTTQLNFLAYAQGEATSTISTLEAEFKTP